MKTQNHFRKGGSATECFLCPRNCGANRRESFGFCACGEQIEINRVSLHHWEEPCISGERGSGTVFFSGCNLGCVFCQNSFISCPFPGKRIPSRTLSREEFCDCLLKLQESGAENINLVTPTHFTVEIATALEMVRPRLEIPVVWNSGGYEKTEVLRRLEGLVDVYLPDLKFFSEKSASLLAGAPDYFSAAEAAIGEMLRQQPRSVFENGRMRKGVLIRHLVLPGRTVESRKILDFVAGHFPGTPVSLMCQYVPAGRASEFPSLDRKLKYREYSDVKKHFKTLGLTGYFQQPDSARGEYTPDFTDSGLLDSFCQTPPLF